MVKNLLFLALLPLFGTIALAQTAKDVTVALSAEVTNSSITLNWPLSGTADIQIKRRIKGQTYLQWTQLLNETASSQTSFIDNNITAGSTYEYHIRTIKNGLTAHGYALVSVYAPVVDYRGKILVFIDSTTADAVGLELKVFKDAMRGDGWQPVPFKTGPSSTVQSIKNQIVAAYNADPTNVKAILLIGSVPVPYSGNAAWDGHSDHAGAWPSDAYYADINGIWTDASVNNTTPSRAANVNVPGDGKFDQVYLPSPAELLIGRIDFRRLSPATFGATPIELTKRYLLKNARWRTKQYTVPHRALVDDNFGYFSGEAFAANGYRNAYPLVGESNVSAGDFLGDTGGEGYLLGYGTGAGSYTSAAGVGTSSDMAADSINIVFSNIFGSYHGDWDYENNPLMPAALASKGGILTCGWAGRPHWFMQGLASGETIGYCVKETMNDQLNAEYANSVGKGGAHVALLGDPTVRAMIVAPVADLQFDQACTTLDLKWTASPDTGILGYHIYRATGLDGPYDRITSSLVNGLTWTDPTPLNDTLYYQVRAVRLDKTPGGGIFYNSSAGIIKSFVFQAGIAPQLVTSIPGVLTCNDTLVLLSANANMPLLGPITWTGPNGFSATGNLATVNTPGVYTATATNLQGCTGSATVGVLSNTTTVVLNAPPLVLNCIQPSAVYTLPTLAGIQYRYNGQVFNGGDTIIFSNAGIYQVETINTVTGCSGISEISVQVNTDTPDLVILASTTQLSCTEPVATLIPSSSASPVVFAWIDIIIEPSPFVNVSEAGEYCVIATNIENGCTATSCITITQIPNNHTAQTVVTAVSTQGAADGGITLIANDATPGTLFEWSNGATTQDIAGLAAGIYTVTITYEDGCMLVLVSEVAVGTNAASPLNEWGISVAPNPAYTFAKIVLRAAKPAAATLKLMDVNGKLMSMQNGGLSTETTFTIDTRNLPDGFYTIVLSDGEKIAVRKLIVCKSEQ